MTKVFGAAGADPLIYELQARLPAVRDASVLLVSADLGADANRNKIVGQALEASARGTLVVVRLDGAEAPIGLRDVTSLPWTPGSPGAKAELRAIADAVDMIQPTRSPPAGPAPMPAASVSAPGRASGLSKRRLIGGAAGAVAVIALALVIMKPGLHAPSPTSEPAPAATEAAPPPTVGAVEPNNEVAGAEAPNASPDTLNNTGSLNAAPTQESPAPSPPPPEQTPPRQSQAGVVGLLAISIVLLLAVLALQALILLTQVNGAAWLRESRDKLMARLPFKLARPSKPAAAPAAPVAEGGGKGAVVFASYSRKDRDSVDPLILDIEHEGLPVWLDRVDIAGGAIWPEAIVQAIRGARAVVVFCSPNAFNSDNVLREINLAASYGKALLPIVLAPSEVPDSFLYYLATCQFVDLSADPNWRGKVLDRLRAAA